MLKERMKCRLESLGRDRKPFIILYLYMLLLYVPLIFLRLTNQYDGLWNQDDYMAGAWELSNGRWFWPYLDHARFGISLDPLPGIVAMAGFVLAVLMIGRILEIRWNLQSYLAAMVFLASTGIACQLSFSYMSLTFAFSTVTAVLAVYVLTVLPGSCRGCILQKSESHAGKAADAGKECGRNRNRILLGVRFPLVLLSAAVIAVMMGCYQASLGITCLCAMAYFMRQLTERENSCRERRGAALHFAWEMFLALVFGGVLYIAGLKLHEWLFHVEPADYQGFADLTAEYLLQHLPEGILHAYYTFGAMFLDGTFLVFFGQTGKWVRLLYLVPVLLLIVQIARCGREDLINGILMAAGAVILPVFANAFYLLAPESECHMQMIVPMTLVIPLVFWTTVRELPAGRRVCARCLRGISVLGCGLFLWTGAAMTLTDEYAMYVGRRATEQMAKGILSSMNAQNYDYLSGSILIVGNPCESSVFQKTELYQKANAYAQYGNWTDELGLNNQIWEEFFSNYLRVNVSFAAADTRDTICSLAEVAAMPVYPAAGSVQNIYGAEVIKLAELP